MTQDDFDQAVTALGELRDAQEIDQAEYNQRRRLLELDLRSSGETRRLVAILVAVCLVVLP